VADASQAQGLDPRTQAQEKLNRLPVDLETLPKELLARLEERARAPDRRLMVGRYLVAGELGRGGMGVVYDAWDPGIERRVAVKTIEPDLVPEEDRDEVIERFRRETKIVGRLHHPGIVTIFDYGEEREPSPGSAAVAGSKLFYYVMEYLEGQSLARVLRERRTMPDVEAVAIVTDILEALAVSHFAGVIHRDIKPSNIFLRGGTQAVLLDFGIAKTGSVALTRQGQILGTPSYLAPERLREKETPVDGRADIFSLGVLLFTMITGEAPFVGEDVYDVIDKIAKTAHPKLARSTPSGQALSRVLDRMLAKKPDDRYSSANEAAIALRGVLGLLRATSALAGDGLFVQGVRIRDEIPDNAATEIATPSSALPSLSDHEADTGRHALVASVEMPLSSVTPMDESGQMMGALSAETPVRMSELLGTRPELSLQRETRELDRGLAKSIPPPLPVRTLVTSRADSTVDDHRRSSSGEISYEGHGPTNDETTDDQTIADPDAGRRGGPEGLTAPKYPTVRGGHESIAASGSFSPSVKGAKVLTGPVNVLSKSPSGGTPVPLSARSPLFRAPSKPAIEKQQGEHLRASSAEHSEQKTEQDRSARPTVRKAVGPPPRAKRSRIEASLVDEDDVVVKPAPLDALKPDEMPTQTGFRVPQSSRDGPPQPIAEDVQNRIADPAERAEDRTHGGVMLKDDDSGETPELDMPRSAAVARKTFGTGRATNAPKTNSKGMPIQVRMVGNVGSSADRMRLVRRRGFMLLAAMLAAIAVGLLLGRLKQRGNASESAQENKPLVEPRAMKALPDSTNGEIAIVKPPPATEILQEASNAFLEGKLQKAERLYDSAVRASPEKSELRAKALLGHADVLRQLGNKEGAIESYRSLLADSPRSAESENARVALGELGVEVIQPVKRVQSAPKKIEPKEETDPSASALPKPEEKVEKKLEPPVVQITPDMTPEQKCRALMTIHLNDRAGAVKALTDLARVEPNIGCVYWHLGNSYKQMGDDRAALVSFRRFLEVEPGTPRRSAVEQKIRDLATKLEER
jgi:serine/threonine protein kinase/tetratricopeptide (TPR) repeat protein